jgi:uncharacterized protein (DUF4415 family)
LVFEWDPRKAQANAAKQGVTFDDAVTVFWIPTHSTALTCSIHRRNRGWDGRPTATCSSWRIRSGEVTMPKRSGSSARGGRAAASVRRTRRKIDFSDIPDSSREQLAVMRRVGRPPIGKAPRQLIAIRVDPSVLESFRKEARRRRVGYQTLINEVLAEYTRKDVP